MTGLVGGSTSPGGSATQVQFNSAGAFGGITGATTDGTTLSLVAPILGAASATALTITGTVGAGYIELQPQNPAPSTPAANTVRIFSGSAGTFSMLGSSGFISRLAISSITANRTFTLPDLAGTFALTANNLSVFASTTSAQLASIISDETGSGSLVFGTSPALITPDIGVATGTSLALTGVISHGTEINSGNGAASVSQVLWNGTVFTGGSATTTFPAMFVQPNGTTAVTTWSTSGTGLGMNLASGFAGNFLDFHKGGAASIFSISSTGGVSAGSYTTAGTVNAGTSSFIGFTSRSYIDSPSDGVIRIANNATTDFTRLQFGGTTSSFPAIKRSSATLAFRLADDSADAAITTAGITASGSTTYNVASAGTILKQGANGRVGTFVANGVTPVAVSNTSVAITDAIIISLNAGGGTVGTSAPIVATITAGVGFTTQALALDTSTYNYAIIKNA